MLFQKLSKQVLRPSSIVECSINSGYFKPLVIKPFIITTKNAESYQNKLKNIFLIFLTSNRLLLNTVKTAVKVNNNNNNNKNNVYFSVKPRLLSMRKNVVTMLN